VDLPKNLRYTPSHEWLAEHGDGTATIGITAVATEQLGDLVYVELPAVGVLVKRGDPCAVVESSKAASDVYAPAHGRIVAVNGALKERPELVNASPYDQGWLFKLELSAPPEQMLTRDAYAASAGAAT
jgi:glycine cleavage system H protein